MQVDTSISAVDSYVQSVRQEFETQLKQLVNIPSVSMDPAHTSNISRTADEAKKILESIGAHAQVITTRGNPVVFGEIVTDVRNPTVIAYNHLDVQPADAAEWKTPPFDLQIENGLYRGRGSTDDKGPALAVAYAAKYISQHKIPINIKFIWELEEEIGSPSFEGFLKEHKDKLKTNSVLVSDTIWVSRYKPAIPYGLRGLLGMLLRLETGTKDVHSGLTGGLARNPIGELCKLISQCYDASTGAVLIPGFYDDVVPPSDNELNDFVSSGFSIAGFMKDHELKSIRTTDTRDGAQRIWAQPTFEVHGLVGGYSGPGIKTIVPHKAEAKVSMRLVPDQDPDKIMKLVTAYLQKHCPDVEVIPEGSLHPYLGELSGTFAQAARKAMVHAFGIEPAFTREGGSIGAVVSMSKVLNAPIVFLGLSLPEHGYHAVNEHFDWQQASGGMKMFIEYFNLLCDIK